MYCSFLVVFIVWQCDLVHTVMILSFRTDRSGQIVQTQIRLQSDQGLHCLQFWLHLLSALSLAKPSCSNFRLITANFLGVRIFRIFTVPLILRFHPVSPVGLCLSLDEPADRYTWCQDRHGAASLVNIFPWSLSHQLWRYSAQRRSLGYWLWPTSSGISKWKQNLMIRNCI